MKNSELYTLKKGLETVGNLKGLKFAIMVAKNLKAVSDEIQTFSDNIVPPKASEEFLTYDKARVDLAEEYADRDDNGNPIVVNNRFVMYKRQSEFDTAFIALREEHKEVVEKRNAVLEVHGKEVQELMDTESVVPLCTVSESALPEELTAAQLGPLLVLVQD